MSTKRICAVVLLGLFLQASYSFGAPVTTLGGSLNVGTEPVGATDNLGAITIGGSSSAGAQLSLFGEGTATNQANTNFTFLNYESGGLGNLYIYPQHETSAHFLSLLNWSGANDVHLNVDGSISLYPSVASTYSFLYGFYQKASDSGIYVQAGNDLTKSRLATHKDPREVQADAITSFADPNVYMPFSFTHENPVLGRGEVVDMAKLVGYVEAQMQRDLGIEAGRLRYDYALPEDEILDDETHQAAVRENLRRGIEKQNGWQLVDVGYSGKIPNEAIIAVEETATRVNEVLRKQSRLDLESQKIIEEEVLVKEEVVVGTGKFVKQLAPNYQFVDGKLYKKLSEPDLDAQVEDQMKTAIPNWLKIRQ